MLFSSQSVSSITARNRVEHVRVFPRKVAISTLVINSPTYSTAAPKPPVWFQSRVRTGAVSNNVVPIPGVSSAQPPDSNSPAATTSNASPTQENAAAPSPGSQQGSITASTVTPDQPPVITSNNSFSLKPVHIFLFLLFFLGGGLVASLTLQFTAQLDFVLAVTTVTRRVTKSVAFRQLVVISCTILFIRFGLNALLKAFSKLSHSPVQWDKTKLYYILREVYQPLELLLFIAGLCTISDSYVPQLISVPKATVTHVVKAILSVSFIVGASGVVFNLKSRFCKENAWQNELKGDVTSQRRWEAYDKLGTFGIYAITFVLGIQAIGLEVTSVLAIGGIGGLAIGLAGREICENLLNGFLIMSTSPFEVGDEVTFLQNGRLVEGLVMDIGWYRTLVRSFEREVYVIPNAVFSKNVVLNVTRKNKEWRFFEMLSVRVQDVHKVPSIIQDVRRIVRSDSRILNKLHKRVFLDKITHDDCRLYISFYTEALNRDAFMAIKQDLLLAFVDCVERNGARLAMPRTVVDVDQPELLNSPVSPLLSVASVLYNQQKLNMDAVPPSGAPPEPSGDGAAASVSAATLQPATTSAAEGSSVQRASDAIPAVPSLPVGGVLAVAGAQPAATAYLSAPNQAAPKETGEGVAISAGANMSSSAVPPAVLLVNNGPPTVRQTAEPPVVIASFEDIR